jgi:hypothetical protein
MPSILCCAALYVCCTCANPHTLPITISLLRGRAEAAGVHVGGLWGILLLLPKLRRVTDHDMNALSRFYSLADPLVRRGCRLLKAHLDCPRSVPDICLLHQLSMRPCVHAMASHIVLCALCCRASSCTTAWSVQGHCTVLCWPIR